MKGVNKMPEQEFNAVFSKRLRYYLNKYGITQIELAKKLGVGTTSVYNWCNGIKTPRMDKVDMMCDLFHCNRSDLMEEKKEQAQIDPDIRRIQRAREKMSEQEKSKMMKILEASFDDYFGDDFVDEDNN